MAVGAFFEGISRRHDGSNDGFDMQEKSSGEHTDLAFSQ
jgi:hypothetical protein